MSIFYQGSFYARRTFALSPSTPKMRFTRNEHSTEKTVVHNFSGAIQNAGSVKARNSQSATQQSRSGWSIDRAHTRAGHSRVISPLRISARVPVVSTSR